MKKSLLLASLAFAVVLSSCKKEDTSSENSGVQVSTDQKAFVLKFSATWCPPCGANAVPISQQLHNEHPYDVCGVTMQCGSTSTPDYTMPSNVRPNGSYTMQSAYNVTGIPHIIVGIQDAITTYDDVWAKCVAYQAPATVAGIGVTKSLSGTTLTINWKVKFFQASNGDGARLALYVIENNVPITSQAGNSSCKELSNVFRGIPNGWTNAWGKSLSTGAVAAGQIYEGTENYTLISDVKNPDKLEVVAVLYSDKMNGQKANGIINCNSSERH